MPADASLGTSQEPPRTYRKGKKLEISNFRQEEKLGISPSHVKKENITQ